MSDEKEEVKVIRVKIKFSDREEEFTLEELQDLRKITDILENILEPKPIGPQPYVYIPYIQYPPQVYTPAPNYTPPCTITTTSQPVPFYTYPSTITTSSWGGSAWGGSAAQTYSGTTGSTTWTTI